MHAKGAGKEINVMSKKRMKVRNGSVSGRREFANRGIRSVVMVVETVFKCLKGKIISSQPI